MKKVMSIQDFANHYYSLPENERDINEWVPVLEKLVYSITVKYTNLGDFEDVYQIGWIAATKCIDNYDISKGVAFCSFVSRAIYNEYNCEYRTKKKQWIDRHDSSKGYFEITSLNTTVSDKSGDPVELQDLILSCEEEGYDDILEMGVIEGMMNRMNDRDKNIMELNIKGLSQADIAKEIGLAQPQVCRILSRMKMQYKALANKGVLV